MVNEGGGGGNGWTDGWLGDATTHDATTITTTALAWYERRPYLT